MLKKYFWRGLLIITPMAATYLILKALLVNLEAIIGESLQGYHFYIPGLGILVLVILIIFVGMVGGNFIGRKIVEWWDSLLDKLPVVNKIYSIAKSVVDTISNGTSTEFSSVCLVEFPRRGAYSIGFVTRNEGLDIPGLDCEMVNVFVPTTPNPTSGFSIVVPKTDIIRMSFSVEEGMKMIFSGGFYSPPAHSGLNHKKVAKA